MNSTKSEASSQALEVIWITSEYSLGMSISGVVLSQKLTVADQAVGFQGKLPGTRNPTTSETFVSKRSAPPWRPACGSIQRAPFVGNPAVVLRGASHFGPVWKRRSPAPTTASGDWSNGAWNTNDEANRDGALPSVQPANRAIEAIRQRKRMPRPCPYPVRLETPFLARRIPCTHELRRALFAVS